MWQPGGNGAAVGAISLAFGSTRSGSRRYPPAGGMAFLAVYLKVAWGFLLFPVLSGSLLLVLLAWAFSRWVPGAFSYPQHWL